MAPQFYIKKSAARTEFSQYTTDISCQVISEFGSFMTQQEARNIWRAKIAYRPDIEKFLIDKTKLYIRILPSGSNATNPVFLKSLINLMADYLSAYTMRAGNMTRHQATKKLVEKLWDKNAYIQGMLTYQVNKRAERRTPQTTATKRRHENIRRAKKDRSIHSQVQQEFLEVSQYRIK